MDTHEKAIEMTNELKHMTQELKAMKKHAAQDIKRHAPKTRPRWLLVVGVVGVVGITAAVVVRSRRRAALAPLISGEDMALKGRPAAAPKDGQVHQMAPVPDGGDAPAARR